MNINVALHSDKSVGLRFALLEYQRWEKQGRVKRPTFRERQGRLRREL